MRISCSIATWWRRACTHHVVPTTPSCEDRPRQRLARHRTPVATLLIAISVLVVGGVTAIPSSAKLPNCSPKGENFYGEACLKGEFNGMSGTIRSYELARGEAQFVDNDMWLVEEGSPPHFIEAGLFVGELCLEQEFSSGTCYKKEWSNGVKRFWGDNRAGSRYYGHFLGAASLGTAYGDKIYYKGSESWSVEVGGEASTSSKNPMKPDLIRTGTEEPLQKASTECSEQYNLEWLNPANNEWHSGWNNGTKPYDEGNSPPYTWWVTEGSWVRDGSHKSNETACY